MRVVYCALVLLIMVGCRQGEDVYLHKATKECSNFELYIGRLFPQEIISLYYNKELILRYKVDSLDGFRFKRHFCLGYGKEGELKIVSQYKGNVYIDTVLNVKKERFGYLLTVSLPHPIDWKNYYENSSSVPTKEWGYLPIDKCVRLVSLNPDTVLADMGMDTLAGPAVRDVSFRCISYL